MHRLPCETEVRVFVICVCVYVCVRECVLGSIPVTVCFWYDILYERWDPWCSSLPLQEVGDVSERHNKVLADGER